MTRAPGRGTGSAHSVPSGRRREPQPASLGYGRSVVRVHVPGWCWGLALTATQGCSFDESLPGSARLLCDADDDCVDGAVCAGDGVCRPRDANLPPVVTVGTIERVIGPLAVPLSISDVDDDTAEVAVAILWRGERLDMNLVPGVLGDNGSGEDDAGPATGEVVASAPRGTGQTGGCIYDENAVPERTVQLPARPEGASSCVVWREPRFPFSAEPDQSLSYVENVRVELSARSPGTTDTSVAFESQTFAYGNTPPRGEPFTDPSGQESAVVVPATVQGVVPIAIRLSDAEGDRVDVIDISVRDANGRVVDPAAPPTDGGSGTPIADGGLDLGPLDRQRFETTAGTTVVVGVIWDSSAYPPVRDATLTVTLVDPLTPEDRGVTLSSGPFDLLGGPTR